MLNKEDMKKSFEEVDSLKEILEHPGIITNVIAEMRGDTVFDNDINVFIKDIVYSPHGDHIVVVNWEEAGITINEYKNRGLFGYYSTNFQKMYIEKNRLIIESSAGAIVKIKIPE